VIIYLESYSEIAYVGDYFISNLTLG